MANRLENRTEPYVVKKDERVRDYLTKIVFPNLQVDEEDREGIIDNVMTERWEGGTPIGTGLPGVYLAFANYLQFVRENEHGEIFGRGGNPDFYHHGIIVLEQLIRALDLLDANPELKKQFLERK